MVGNNSTVSFTNKELNDYVLSLFKNYADEAGIYTIETVHLEFRVTSVISEAKTPLVSNIVSSTVTPYDNENTGYKAAVITSTDISELVLAAGKKEETALPLTWQQAYLGDNASISYAIEINLPKTNTEYNWSKKVTVKTTQETSYNLTHQDLNDALVSLLAKYSKEVGKTEINLSVSATKSGYIKALASEPLTISITPYVATPTFTTVPENMDLTSGTSYSLAWEAVEGAKYQVEMDIKDAEFSQRAILESGLTSTNLDINNAVLSKAIKYLKMAHNAVTLSAEQKVEFRVRAYFGNTETGVLSEAKTVTVTYDNSENTPEVFYLVGEYCAWKHDQTQKLYKTESGSYKGHIIAKNLYEGWKITDQPNWNGRNWGAPINSGILTLGNDSKNITSYGGNNNTNYTVEFNPNNGRLTMSNEEKSWMLLGEHNNYSFSDASKMEIIYDESNKKWYLQKKGVKMQAGNTWQIRSQILNMEVTPQNAEGHFETDVTDESQFTVSQTGNYEIRWYFNEPTPYVIVIKE
ncbi:hypothetical protein BFINE_03630 [Bacteroides finegoldii DSM 17565]|nr:hypothetical protein BFINE_03630 [Bacteroides finegoldii DSM 17565]